ncbi:MAG: ATP-binding protein [Myxococcaceae bacterium]
MVDALAQRAQKLAVPKGSRNELVGTWWELLDAMAHRCGTRDGDGARARWERLLDTHLALRRHLGFSLDAICDEIAFVSRELSETWLKGGPDGEPDFEDTRIFFQALESAMERAGCAYYGDLASRRRHDRQTLRRLDQALADATANEQNRELGELLEGPLRVICEAVAADGAAIHLLEADQELVLVVATGAVNPTGLGNRVRVGEPTFVSDAALAEDLVELCDATAARTKEFDGNSHPLRTMIATRLWPNGRLLGVLTLARTRIEPFPPPTRQLLDLLSEYLSTIIDRARLTTAVREANEQIRRQHELYRLTVEAQNDLDHSVVVIRGHAAIFVNDAFCRTLGYTREELLAMRDLTQILSTETRAETRTLLREIFSGRKRLATMDVEVLTKAGDKRELAISCKHMPPAGSELDDLLILIGRDVTEKRRIEREEKQRREFIEYLIGVASHDLRNPLTAVMMSATSLLRRDDLDYRVHAQLMRVVSSTRRASRLIRDLLDFTSARMGAGVPLERRPTELRPLLTSVLEEIRSAYPDRTVLLEDAVDVRGDWDPDRLAQVFTNLVTNALQYSPAGQPVTVRVGADAGLARVSVHNRGRVIPEDMREAIFEPLKRGGAAQRDRFGLGLFIVQAIAAAHDGSVHVSSSAEDGTTFTVSLPQRAESEAALQL